MASLAHTIVSAMRSLFARRNERGVPTTDIFRLMVRKKVRDRLRGRSGLVLDIGCGEGYLLENILGDGRLKAVLFDNSGRMLDIASREYFPRLKKVAFPVKGDARILPFKDGSLDFAVCVNTFYNLPSGEDVARSFREIGAVIKAGGSLFFDVRNRSNPLVKRAYQKVESYDPSIGSLPLNAYTLREIKGMLSASGFTMKSASGLILPILSLSPIIVIEAVKN